MTTNYKHFISYIPPQVLRQFKHFLVLNNAYSIYKQEFHAPFAIRWRQGLFLKRAPIALALLSWVFPFMQTQHPNMWFPLRAKWDSICTKSKYNSGIDIIRSDY